MGYKDWYNNSIYKVTESKKSYWKNWSDWDFDDDLYGGYSTSTWVTENEEEKKRRENKKKCEDALKSIGRSANVILNSADETERKLAIKFSNGTNVNTLENNTIYLSPDKLLAAETTASRHEVVDAMCGQSMLSAQLKRQLDKVTFDKFIESKDACIRSLWSSIELAIARGDIISDWVGFKPYFDTYAAFSSKMSSSTIKKLLKSSDGSSPLKPTSAKALIAGIAWNLYHSHDPVKIPAAYDEGKKLIAEGLSTIESCEDRWKFCTEIVQKLRDMYDGKSSTPPPTPKKKVTFKETGEDLSGEELIKTLAKIAKQLKADSGTAKTDGVPPLVNSKFSGVDEELFGLKAMGNSSFKAASDIDEISGDSVKEIKDVTSAPAYMSKYLKNQVSSATPFWVPKDNEGRFTKSHFNTRKMNELDRLANSIKDSFNFTDKEIRRRVYGLSSGAIHPESAYRITMGEDRIFYKKSTADVDKVSVCLLIDQSGSMQSVSYGRTEPKYVEAAEVGYVVAKVCKDLKNLDLSVIGFNSQERCPEAVKKRNDSGFDMDRELNFRMIYDSLDPKNDKISDICNMKFHANNLDGYAIWHAAKYMAETRAASKRKIVIIISDGSPNARNYGGEDVYDHVNTCRKDAKHKFNVETYAIGISSAYSKELGDRMYGAGNNIVIDDVKSSIGYITRFLNQLSQAT